jgi:hypothetical protein
MNRSQSQIERFFNRCPRCRRVECVCESRQAVLGMLRWPMTVLTVIAGLGVGWLYYHRVTFDEPLFFLMEFIVNLPLLFAFFLFLMLLCFTVSLWVKR